MNRSTKQTTVNDRESRYEVTIVGDPCEPGTVGLRIHALDLLRTLTSTPGLLDCGMNFFQEFRMKHDGEKWVITLEAVGP